MSLILLDNVSRGTTTLLASCVPATTSDQLADGAVGGDGTGDTLFNAARKLKQWAADQNAMNGCIFGNYLSATAQSGLSNNWDPTGGNPGNISAVSRLDITPDPANSTLSGLIATNIVDEKRITLRNLATLSQGYTLTLQHLGAGSSSANQFYGPGQDFLLNPGMTIEVIYYRVGGLSYWVIKP